MAGVTEDREAPQVGPPQAPTPPPQEPVGVGPRRPPGSGLLAEAAWIVIGAGVPVTVLASLFFGFWVSYDVYSGLPANIWLRLLSLLLLVIAPTAALACAFQAARWGSTSGKVALGVSATLLIAALVWLAYLGWLVEWVIPWVLVTGLLLLLVWIFGKKPPRPAQS